MKTKDNNNKNNRNFKVGNKVSCRYFNSQDKVWGSAFTGIITEIKENVKSKNPDYYGNFETIFTVTRFEGEEIPIMVKLHIKEIIRILENYQISYNQYWDVYQVYHPEMGMTYEGSLMNCLKYVWKG